MDYGIWTLLPIVVVVAVALKSRRALEPLILGTLLTYIIVDGLSFPIGWMDAFFRVATDQSHQWVFMVCGLFGALIAFIVLKEQLMPLRIVAACGIAAGAILLRLA